MFESKCGEIAIKDAGQFLRIARWAVLLTMLFMLFGLTAFAQDAPKIEVGINYSYDSFNPSSEFFPNSYTLNGGGGSVVYNWKKWLGFKGEFQGYGNSTESYDIPAGESPICRDGCAGSAQANLQTYMVGPQVGVRSGKFRPFTEFLFGGAHTNLATNIYNANSEENADTPRPSSQAFAISFGGGIDIAMTQSGRVSFRPIEIDYLWTHFDIATTGGQGNFQYKAGIVLNF